MRLLLLEIDDDLVEEWADATQARDVSLRIAQIVHSVEIDQRIGGLRERASGLSDDIIIKTELEIPRRSFGFVVEQPVAQAGLAIERVVIDGALQLRQETQF